MQSLSSVEVPKGTVLHVRLVNAVGSFASRPGSPVEAVLIAPVKVGGVTLFPTGSTLTGEVKSVQRVGLGFVHETSALNLEFTSISAPGDAPVTLPTRLAAVDTGREEVLPSGTIQESRRTGSLGNRAAHLIRTFVLWDVHAQIAIWAVKSLVMQVSEPEIFLPPGTELTLTLTEPISAQAVPADGDGPQPLTDEERASLAPVIAALPTRTETPVKDRPSDLVNLMFVGSRSEISAAFRAAGWNEARRSTFRSNLSGAFAVVVGRGDRDAPMSPLLINEAPADMAWQKGFNDLSKRHHIRLWKQKTAWDGQEVWIGAATRDIAFAYFRPGRLIAHKVARQVDRERDKIMDDLAFTSCADSTGWWDRPEVPHFVRNATGDAMETDSRLGIVRLNACDSPRQFAAADDLPAHGKSWQLMLRRQVLNVRSDLLRHSIYWRGYEGMRYLVDAVRHKPEVDPDAPPSVTLASRENGSKLNSYVSIR
jgi:hypothetical protein